jgi:cytochrome d ubiquinol oxidase subunit II
VAFVLAALVLGLSALDCPELFRSLLRSPWSVAVQLLTAIAAVGVLVSLVRRQMGAARVLVMAQVALIVLGWGLAMDGHLVWPDLHVEDAGAREPVLRSLPWVLSGGAVLFVPALVWLFRVFKGDTGSA